MKYLFFALRPTQWIKNFFVFLPLIFGKKLFVFPSSLNTAIGFFLFSLAASAAYLVNDIIDIEKDRLHPTKRLRPLASGKISLRQALFTAFILGIVSLILSFTLNIYFGYIIAAYYIFNFLYSKILKNAVIIDVFCIACFLYMRVAAGGVLAGVNLSYWILIMSMLLALFLGFNKRRQEIRLLQKRAVSHRMVLSRYNSYFIDQMVGIVASSAAIAYILYTVDARTIREFGTYHLIYSVPFVYYGIFRYLYLIHNFNKEGDPARIILGDRKIQISILLWIIVCIIVIYFGV